MKKLFLFSLFFILFNVAHSQTKWVSGWGNSGKPNIDLMEGDQVCVQACKLNNERKWEYAVIGKGYVEKYNHDKSKIKVTITWGSHKYWSDGPVLFTSNWDYGYKHILIPGNSIWIPALGLEEISSKPNSWNIATWYTCE